MQSQSSTTSQTNQKFENQIVHRETETKKASNKNNEDESYYLLILEKISTIDQVTLILF